MKIIIFFMLTIVTTFNTYAGTIIIPDDYADINNAIQSALNGDVIFVKSGTYEVNILIDKSISLIGEDRKSTIINGAGKEYGVYGKVSDITIENLMIKNSSTGIIFDNAHRSIINRCIIKDINAGVNTDTICGIHLKKGMDISLKIISYII